VRVTAVIVHWRHLDDTLACLRSLEPDVDAVVVDNGSSDRVAEAVAGRARCVRNVSLGGRRSGHRLASCSSSTIRQPRTSW